MSQRQDVHTPMATSLARFQEQVLRAVGSAVIATDVSGRITYWNTSAEALYGWRTAEAIGQQVVELVPAEGFEARAEEIMRELARGKSWSGDFPVRRRDGSQFIAHVHDAPVLDDEGHMIGVVGVSRDVTAERAAARALAASNERFELAARATRDVLWELDVRTRRLWRNENFARLLGVESAPSDENAWGDRMHPEDRERVTLSLEAALRSPGVEAWSQEYRIRRADGSHAHVLDRAYIVRDARGEAQRVIGALIDMTERREADRALLSARESLAQVEKLSAIGMLVSGVAHEVRTPLAYIATNLHLAQTRLELAAQADLPSEQAMQRVSPHILDALQGVDRINRLVLELRRFQKVPAGGRALRQLQEPVTGAVELFRATSAGRVHLDLRLEPTPAVHIDEAQVQQVALNLLENAADAAPGGRVSIQTRPTRDGGAELVVHDDGPGIPEEIRGRMFEAFFTTKSHGTGLGLSIVQRIANEHGARLSVESATGKGTRISLRFPPPQASAPAADDEDDGSTNA